LVVNTRRAFLGAGFAAGGAVALGACGGGDSLKRQLKHDPPLAETDVALLNHLVDLEYLAVAAYTAGLPLLKRPASRAAKQFLAQELGHADGISLLVREAGGKANKPRQSYDLGNPRTPADVLRLLHEVETLQIGAYLNAIPRLGPAKLRQLTTQYFANDAQHISILRSLLGEPALPAPFLTARQ
jgi:Ferritin-like domain